MRIQVVHCHPLTSSYNHALFEAIVETLAKNGHQVVATDLYREGFQPAMTEHERATYMREDYDRSAVADYCETLKSVDGLILCFPHWWFSMPAMLKGWVDRVWGPGIAFDYDPKDNHLEPALRNIKLFGVVTTYGSPWWVAVLFAGNAGKKVLMRGMKPMCAKGVRSFYMAHYDMDHSSEALAARLPRQGPAANVAAIASAPCAGRAVGFGPATSSSHPTAPLRPHCRSYSLFEGLSPLLSPTRKQKMRNFVVLAAILLTATACGDTWGQRAVTGGGIGAGSGAVIGALTGMGPLTGALIGGAVGAGAGAATTPRR